MPIPIFQFPDGQVNHKSYVFGGFEGIYTLHTGAVKILLIYSKKFQLSTFRYLLPDSKF